MDLTKLLEQKKGKIWRIAIGDKKGKFVGFKLVDANDVQGAVSRKNVGPDRRIIGVLPTSLSGTTETRMRLPRARRFGKGFE